MVHKGGSETQEAANELYLQPFFECNVKTKDSAEPPLNSTSFFNFVPKFYFYLISMLQDSEKFKLSNSRK